MNRKKVGRGKKPVVKEIWHQLSSEDRRRRACYAKRLPDECLALIFQKLEWQDRLRSERVCRRWNRVVKASGWTHFNAFDDRQPRLSKVGHKLSYHRGSLTIFPLFSAAFKILSLATAWTYTNCGLPAIPNY